MRSVHGKLGETKEGLNNTIDVTGIAAIDKPFDE
jgi:hypothetical protein